MQILINGNTIGESVTNFLRTPQEIKLVKESKESILNELSLVIEDNENISNYKKLHILDKAIGHIKKNKKMYLRLVVSIALMIHFGAIDTYALSPNLNAIDKVGQQLLTLMRKVGYWVFMILCGKDVITKCMQGKRGELGSVVALHLMAFGTLYFLPWAFDLIQQLF